MQNVWKLYSIINNSAKNDTSDLAQLELEENRLIKEFIKNNFEVRIIVSLDIKAIFENALYTEEQYIERSENLVFYLKSIMNNTNLKIAFDDENKLNSVYILDTLLMCNEQNEYLDSNEKNYKNTVLNSTLGEIIYEIEKFDKRFYELRIYNDIVKKALGIEASKDYVLLDKIYKSRLDVYIKKIISLKCRKHKKYSLQTSYSFGFNLYNKVVVLNRLNY